VGGIADKINEIDAPEGPSTPGDATRLSRARVRSSIRRATPDDAGDVAGLLHDFNTEFGDPTPGLEALTDRLRDLIARDELIALLGGDRPEGLAIVRLRSSLFTESLDAYLEELYVAPQRRGHGLGRALLEAAMEHSRRAGARRMELGTSVDDTAAITLYGSAGFTNREREPDGPSMLFYERDL
jgi:ribosomal protein S18 acetylase RimI-like enzyme